METEKSQAVHITFQNILDTSYTKKLREWRNQDFVRKNMTNHDIISESEHEAYIDSLRKSDTNQVFLACNHGEPLAIVTIKINREEHYVEPGTYIINEDYLGKGFGIIMSYMRLEYIFELMPEGRMRTVILNTNERNLSLQKKMGCVLEEEIMVRDQKGNEEPASVLYLTKEAWDQNKISIEKRIEDTFGLADIERIPVTE